MDPGSENDYARSNMSAIKKYAEDTGGALAAGGTANALTVTTKQVLDAAHVTDGLRLMVKATADNDSATVTFAPDGLTARNIKRADGSALVAGLIKSGMYLDLVYNLSATEWRCANIPPGGAVDYQAFTSGGTWTKPTGISANAITIIEAWGAGGRLTSRG